MQPTLWKTGEIAHDLQAQLAELREAGASDEALRLALEREGVLETTAVAMLRDWAAVGHAHEPQADAVYGVDLSHLRRWIRALPLDAATRTLHLLELQTALSREGLATDTARALVTDVADDCAAMDARQRARLRRLGLQGIVASGLFAGYFVSVTVASLGTSDLAHAGSHTTWNAFTALLSIALAVYSALLWHRHRPLPPSP